MTVQELIEQALEVPLWQVFSYDVEKPTDSPSREEEYRAYHTR